MPSKPHAPSARNSGTRPWLLVGLSVRALAQAAARGGRAVCALDAFADRDTADACGGHVLRLQLDDGYRIARAPLVDAVASARRRFAPDGFAGIVAGSGFEACPDLLRDLAAMAPLAGCGAEVLARLRTPRRWFALLDALDIPHPPVRYEPPAQAHNWLVKSGAGAGGRHVRRWRRSSLLTDGDYLQQHRPGRPASVLFVADGRRARVLGWQWQLPVSKPGLPWCYGGIVVAKDMPTAVRARITAALVAIVARVPIAGLAGLDFLVDGDEVAVLELNARPTASIALYPQQDVFGLHLAAANGSLPETEPFTAAALRGEAVVYAHDALAVGADFSWPDHCADIPAAAAEFGPGDPVCTVRAQADSPHSLRRHLVRRRRALLNTLMENQIREQRPEPFLERLRPLGTARPGAAG